ncbi:MAG: CopG family antitoxin [Prochlorotrichaceae cyanobacterium]|jgi:predicted RNase H-like nuclease
MKAEYDFSKAERGKFYRDRAKFNIPVYLDEEILEYFSQRAKEKGVSLDDLINALLKQGIALIEGVK